MNLSIRTILHFLIFPSSVSLGHTSSLEAVAVTFNGSVGWALNSGGSSIDEGLSVIVSLVWAVLEGLGVDVLGVNLSHTSGLKAIAVSLDGSVGWALNGSGSSIDKSLSVIIGLVWAMLERGGVDVLGVDLSHTGGLEAIAVSFN